MATINANIKESVFPINGFLGVNENPDGDTHLKMGEAAHMMNFKITDNYALQKRPGTKQVAGLCSGYDIVVASTATTLLTETNVSTQNYTLYPDVALNTSGTLTVSGASVSVTYANFSSYIGYYWQDAGGNVYKLANCTLTHPSSGTSVSGGTISVATTTVEIGFWPSVVGYDSVAVRNSAVVPGDNGNLYDYWAVVVNNALAGKYIYVGGNCYSYVSVASGNNQYFSVNAYLVSRVGDDTYAWNFYAVTQSSGTSDTQVRGIWNGFVNKVEYLVAACNGHLWKLSTDGNFTKTSIGTITTTNGPVHMFGFDQKLYILDSAEYHVWDGTTLSTVAGYRPLIAVTTVPTGGGTLLEQINKLNGLRRVRFSPTGSATDFQLPETGLTSIDYVKNTATGVDYTLSTDYSVDTANGKVSFVSSTKTENFTGNGSTKVFTLSNSNVNVAGITVAGSAVTAFTYSIITKKITFTTAPANAAAIVVTENVIPANGTDTLEIGYTYPTNYRSQVIAMKFSETFNGETDTRVFLYGDGSNTAFYSGILYDTGSPSAEYFPDLNVMEVDSANTPITGMIKHFDRLLTFKTDGAFITTYGTITLSSGATTAGFYTTPLNREIGNVALGQVRLVKNNPLTLYGRSVYEWLLSSYASKDERIAKTKSDRAAQTLSSLDLAKAICFDDEFHSEYYVIQNDMTVVYNYKADVWYIYNAFPASCMISFKQEVYYGDTSGFVRHFSRDYMSDNGTAIQSYWESGSMSFGADFKYKYSPNLWVGLKPEERSEIYVTVDTDRQTDYSEEDVAAQYTEGVANGFFNFLDLDFTKLSFGINENPQMNTVKIKVKKFVYYKLIFSTATANTTATVTGVDIRVRYTGNVR